MDDKRDAGARDGRGLGETPRARARAKHGLVENAIDTANAGAQVCVHVD